jgi:hypothetical protein
MLKTLIYFPSILPHRACGWAWVGRILCNAVINYSHLYCLEPLYSIAGDG